MLWTTLCQQKWQFRYYGQISINHFTKTDSCQDLSLKRTWCSNGMFGGFLQLLRKKWYQSHTNSRELKKRELTNSPYEGSRNFIPNAKENNRLISFMKIDTKLLSKIQANKIQQHVKSIIHHNQVWFIIGM